MIDGGPLRVSRPGSRQAAYRAESVRRQQPSEPQTIESTEPTTAQRSMSQHRVQTEYNEPPRRSVSFGWLKWLAAVLVIAALLVAGWLMWSSQSSIASTIEDDKYQAVFLSNGQVYFGNLSVVDTQYMQLTDVYYLERQLTADSSDSDEQDQPVAGDNNFQLLKYSDVLYGSENAMIISSEDIIRFENLRPDGVVARAIADRR